MRAAISSALAITVAAGFMTTEARAQSVKVAIAHFAPLTGDVPVRAGGKLADLLASELKHVGTIDPIPLTVEKNEAAAEALDAARKAINAAQLLESRRKYGAAAASYRKAIISFDAGASALSDASELSDAHLALGSVLYLTGQDVEGAKELAHAVSLTPSRAFPKEATSALFAATMRKIRGQVMAAPKGTLRVESMPPGAVVLVDGQEIGRTPLTLKDIPPGKHLWRVLLSSSEPMGGTVVVPSGQTQNVAAALGGASAVSHLIAAVANNRLDEAVTAAAKQATAEAGADLLAFGALRALGEQLFLESFLYSAAQNSIVRLPSKTFDAEMLSAGTELYQVAGNIGSRLEQLGEPEKLPTKISLEVLPASTAERSEVAYPMPAETQEKGQEETKKRVINPKTDKIILNPR